jgi:hypothetical protein
MKPPLLLLAVLLAGCQTLERIPVAPNPALTRDCDYPAIEGDSWRALAEAYERRGEALKECNARMRALRSQQR